MIFRSITLQEANLFLPILKEHISKIHALVVSGQVLHEKILSLDKNSLTDTSGGIQLSTEQLDARQALDSIESKVRAEMIEIQKYGAIVKSIFPAQIDFLSKRHEQPVYLSWHSGDKTVSNWRAAEEGLSARRPIENPEEFGPVVLH